MRRRTGILVALALLGFSTAVFGGGGDGALFHFIAPQGSLSYDPADGIASGDFSVFIQEDEMSPGFPNNVSGWAMGNGSDPNLVAVTAVEQGFYLETEIMPAFFAPAMFADGYTVGVVYDFFGGAVCTYEVAKEVLVVTYETNAATLMGDEDGETAALTFVDTLGSPPVANTIVLNDGMSYTPIQDDGFIDLVPVVEASWARGDCNGDGNQNIADGISILNGLFQGGDLGSCLAACDINGDSMLDSSDAVYCFNYQLLDGPPPPAPFPGCGTEEGQDCEAYDGCP